MSTTSMAAGLTGINIFVRPDEQPAFEALKSDLVLNLKPQTPHELYLFDVVLSAAWNVRRCIGLESDLLNEAHALGLADPFFDDELSKKFDRINRYKRQYETSYNRAMKELKQLVAAHPAPEPEPETKPEPMPVATTIPAPPPSQARVSTTESPRGS